MSDINIVRLNSGEEIMCSYEIVENTEGGFYNIKNPAILIPGAEGKLMFARWLPYADIKNGVMIPKSNVVFVCDPMEDLEQHYLTVVVNNLFIPSNKLATPDLKLALDS